MGFDIITIFDLGEENLENENHKIKCEWLSCANNKSGYCNSLDSEISFRSVKSDDNKKEYLQCSNFDWE